MKNVVSPQICITGHLLAACQVYHTKTVSKAGRRGWQGGKDLPDSAVFTWNFCEAVLDAWENRTTEAEEAASDSPALAVDAMGLPEDVGPFEISDAEIEDSDWQGQPSGPDHSIVTIADSESESED